MRDIKFRGKRLDNNEWKNGFYYLYIDNTGKEFHNILNNEEQVAVNQYGSTVPVFTNVDPKTIGQYTGLHDKNGKEIYEGDIVSNGYEKSVVVWIKEQAGFMLKLTNEEYKNEEWTNPMIDLRKDDEVIGNIWEDSDLLNDSKNTETN